MMGLKLLFNNLLSLVKRTLSIHFRPVFHFPWKRLADVFWGYRNGTLDKKGLKTFIKEQKQKTLILEAYLGPCQTSKIYERVLNTPLNSICLSSQLLLTVSQVLTPNVYTKLLHLNYTKRKKPSDYWPHLHNARLKIFHLKFYTNWIYGILNSFWTSGKFVHRRNSPKCKLVPVAKKYGQMGHGIQEWTK